MSSCRCCPAAFVGERRQTICECDEAMCLTRLQTSSLKYHDTVGRRGKAASRRKASATAAAPVPGGGTAAGSAPDAAPPAAVEAAATAAGPEPAERQDAVARLSAFAGLIAYFHSKRLTYN